MALPILAHWAGRSIFDIEPAALARRGIRSCWPIWTIPWRPMGNRSHTGGEGLGGGAGRAGDHPLCALQQPAPRSGPAGFPRRWACPSWATRASRSGGASGGPWSRWLHAGADCHRGGSALYRHSGRRNAGVLTLLVELSAWRAIRGATCATERSGPSACGAKGGQNRYERNLRPGGQRRVLSL